MRRALAVVACLALLVAGTAGVATSTGSGTTADGPTIVGVAPNPVADGDRGEFVAVRVPPGTDLSTLAVADGETVARGPNRTAGGRVLLSTAPEAVPPVSGTVYHLRGDLSLANGGERVFLRHDGAVVDAVRYPAAPPAELWTGSWHPLGATDYDPVAAANVSTRAFALPDAAEVPVSVLRRAERRLYVAAYTFRSRRVARALRDASRRGVDVRLLVEGSPVGGTPPVQWALLGRLAAAGVEVTRLDGPRARYRYHHAKYAVVDDRALVTSENWTPSGTGGGNRGWGAVVASERIADRLTGLFRADAGWLDGHRVAANHSTPPPRASERAFPSRFDAVRAENASVRLLAAPDNAGDGVEGVLRNASESVLVQQVTVDPQSRLLNATLAAARRGARVRVLLSGTWYVREENRRLARLLERRATAAGLDLSVRLADPRGRYDGVHVKGAVVDGERVVLGSLNWNPTAVEENREVALVVEDERVARHFRRVFVADWRGGAWRVPASVVAAVGAAVLLTGLVVARRVTFSEGPRPATRGRSQRRPSSRRGRRAPPPASRGRT